MKDPVEDFAGLVTRYFRAGPAQRPGLAVRAMEAAPHALAAMVLPEPVPEPARVVPAIFPRPSLLHRELRCNDEEPVEHPREQQVRRIIRRRPVVVVEVRDLEDECDWPAREDEGGCDAKKILPGQVYIRTVAYPDSERFGDLEEVDMGRRGRMVRVLLHIRCGVGKTDKAAVNRVCTTLGID